MRVRENEGPDRGSDRRHLKVRHFEHSYILKVRLNFVMGFVYSLLLSVFLWQPKARRNNQVEY